MLSFKDFIGLLEEDAPANATGAMVSTDVPIKSLGMGRRKSQTFDVPIEVFNNFAKGKKKWKKWSDYLNLQDDAERSICFFRQCRKKHIRLCQKESTW